MLEVLLQSGVQVPETTTQQYVIAGTLVAIGFVALIIGYWRAKVRWLSETQQQNRELARAQKRRQTPPMFQAPSEAIREGAVALRSEVRQLFDEGLDASETRSTFRGAFHEVWAAASIAWTGRVEPLPLAAVRAVGWAAAVTVWGAIAVSTGALVAFLQREPRGLSLSAYLDRIVEIARGAVDVVGLFPYGGFLWQLSYAYAILAVDWIYQHWMVVAGLLVLSAVSIIYLDSQLPEQRVPEQVIRHPKLAGAAVLASLVVVWAVGTGVAVIGRHTLGTAVGNPAGFIAAMAVAGSVSYRGGPIAARRVEEGIARVAGEHTRQATAYLLTRRAISALSVAAGVLVVAYIAVSIIGGRLGRLWGAFVTAAPSMQATVVAAGVALVVLAAIAIQDAWGDIQSELHMALQQQAVRAQIFGRGVPVLAVAVAYIAGYSLTRSIVAAVVGAAIVGLVASKAVTLAGEASYRADWKGIIGRIRNPSPKYISYLSYRVEDTDGRTHFVCDVNGTLLANTDLDALVTDAVQIGDALANKEDPPSTESEWFADFLFGLGVADPGEWNEKLDEKIREKAFNTLRSKGPQVTRETFDKAMSDYPDGRVDQVIAFYSGCITRGSQAVSLSRDPFVKDRSPEWPTFGD